MVICLNQIKMVVKRCNLINFGGCELQQVCKRRKVPSRKMLVSVLNPVQTFNQVIPPELDAVDDCTDLGSRCQIYRATLARTLWPSPFMNGVFHSLEIS